MEDENVPPAAAAAAAVANAAANAELTALRQKLDVMQQIQQLQVQIGLQPQGATPRPAQPAMRIKPPEGSYSMSRDDFRTYL